MTLKAYRYRNYYSRNLDHDDFTSPEADSSDSFSSKIPEYALIIKDWFENEKPYLSHNFKLTDVAAVVPLNRHIFRVFSTRGWDIVSAIWYANIVSTKYLPAACRKTGYVYCRYSRTMRFCLSQHFPQKFCRDAWRALHPGDFRAEGFENTDSHSVKKRLNQPFFDGNANIASVLLSGGVSVKFIFFEK